MENSSEATMREEENELLNKEEIETFAKNALPSIKAISEWYGNFFSSVNGDPAIITEIEQKIGSIKSEYENLFVTVGESGAVKEVQSKINDFFQYLFGNGDTGGEEKKIKKIIEEITNFHIELTKDDGIQKKVADAHRDIAEKHSELFDGAEEKKSKVQEFSDNIESIEKFNKKIEEEITPYIKTNQEEIKKIKIDYETKTKDVGSLLSAATIGALAQGYQESKMEYSGDGSMITASEIKSDFLKFLVVSRNLLFKKLPIFLDYIIFVAPLVIILVVFLEPKIFSNTFDFDALYNNGGEKLKGWEFLLLKISVSLPMLWIAWFGQKNISQKKRLAEEYNHKLRVVQIYRMFTDNNNSYTLSENKKVDLENALLEVIKNNPAEILGNGETMIDQIIEKFRFKGFYKELKSEVIEELKPFLKSKLAEEKNEEN
ncbi:MAG: hypothetical protein UR82_C0023G0011 [Candidatus Moranbacteria bacterium GW2011_GWF1_35_5]|nr:MAG: hypothetical protein UR82_C0023G0011 [Candidatus Moranbacteria bacterium GW2011_GWF1_35_5]